MTSPIIRLGLAAAAVAVLGTVAGPAAAEPAGLPLEPSPVATLVPETGSAGAVNGLLCALQTISAELPCLQT
ncbi:hypothetical protein [Nocardia farcinica]|uniref:Uncharacterized protein n=1 Tax=Nocardia farcinica TaxID=37329 RepID=A0A449H4C6_NOCFR|nr:hypothetical protein [Nocardia farcinica]MBF6363171.1 hypothetical protein [Nocardia farcinica]VFA92869.1 Uncharacterised protein [Nocardia farcinica]